MQVATMQQRQSSVYLGSTVPKLSSQASLQPPPPPSGSVKKWKNKLKTFLNSPLPGSSNSNNNNNAVSASLTSNASTGSSTSATPRPESPHEIPVPAIASRPNSPGASLNTAIDHHGHASRSTPRPSSSQQASSSTFQSDVYAGYDISSSFNYGSLIDNNLTLTADSSSSNNAKSKSNREETDDAGGANDSYEARLSRLVGDLENVDYGSFAHHLAGVGASNTSSLTGFHAASHDDDGTTGAAIRNGSGNDGGLADTSTVNDLLDASGNIRISSMLFKDTNSRDMDTGAGYSNHPFAYASAGTPSHLDSSTGPSSSKPFSNSFLSNSLNFQNQFPLSSSPSNGFINIEDALNSFSPPYFTDFSAYTNLDDDLNGSDIRIPSSFDVQQDSSGAPTPSSSASVPLTAVHSASSNDSGSSTAATSEILTQLDKTHRRNQSDIANISIPTSLSLNTFDNNNATFLKAPQSLHHSKSMPFAPFKEHSKLGQDEEDDDDFSKLLGQSQITCNDGPPLPTLGTTGAPLSVFSGQPVPSSQSLATTEGISPLGMTNFDLTMFPMPKSTNTASVKMGSQPSSGSESSYGPSPSLSYGGSSTSNTSFDDPNANKDTAPFTPKKSKSSRSLNRKNLSISLEESEHDSSIVTVSPGVKTPTHSPRPSISSVPPTPASYKTAPSVPTSPYRPRPVIHASALAWRVAPSPNSPQSAIAVDTARTIRPVASQSYINSDPFASPTSPSRLSKLSTASSPELKRRRNTVEDDDADGTNGLQSIDGKLANLQDDSFAAQVGSQMLVPMSESNSPLRPIAYRRRVGHKFSTPQLQGQSTNHQQQLQPAPLLHQRQHSQPLPSINQLPLQYGTSAGMSVPQLPQMNSQQLHTRQHTAPLPSPSTAALNYTQQQQQQQHQHQQQQMSQQNHRQMQQTMQQQQMPTSTSTSNNAWLSDSVIMNLITQLSDQTYMCLMQNCSQRFANLDDTKLHISGHFTPQPVPLQQSQPIYQQQPQAPVPQFQMYQQNNQYPQPQQQTWI